MKLTTLLVAAVLLASTTSPATAREADRRLDTPQPTTATVAADQLGPDWNLAVVTRGNFERLRARGLGRSLELIAPDGTRHPVYSVDIAEDDRGWFAGDFTLADWRPESHTALLRLARRQGDRAVAYDVTTGTQRTVTLPQRAATVGLMPDGSGALITTFPSERRAGRVAVLTWDGVKTFLPARSDSLSLTSTDGRTLVTSESDKHRMWVVDLTTRTSRRIDTRQGCTPRRWWDATSVVATCINRWGSRLMRIGLDGPREPLAIRHRTTGNYHGQVWDDTDVRTVQGRDWFQSNGPCGGNFLTRQTSAGKVRLVDVPGAVAAVSLVGTRGDDLVIAHTQTCESRGPRGVLSLFDPVTREESVLLRLGRRERWREVRPAAEVAAWGW